MNLLNDIRILLTRWSTAFVLLGVLAVAMAGATLIEAGMNLQAAAASFTTPGGSTCYYYCSA